MHIGTGLGDSTGGGGRSRVWRQLRGVTHSMSNSVAAAPMCPNRAI